MMIDESAERLERLRSALGEMSMPESEREKNDEALRIAVAMLHWFRRRASDRIRVHIEDNLLYGGGKG